MRYILSTALLLAFTGPAFAQADETAANREGRSVSTLTAPERAERRALARENNRAPEADPRTGFLGSGVLVSAGGNDTNVTLTLSRSWDGANPNSLNFNSGSLILTGPITDKERKEGTFVTDGGLPSSYSAQVSFTRAWIPNHPLPATSERRMELLRRARARCVIEAPTAASATACESATMRDVQSLLSAAEREEIVDRFPIYLAGVTGSIGTREFEFRRITDLGKDSVNRTEFAASGYFGWSPGSSPLYLGVGYEYRRQYKNIPARTLCAAPVPGNPQECFTASYGEPQRNVDSNVFGVARWQGDLRILGGSLPVGIEVRAAYDTHDRVFGIAVPIYFFSGAEGLRGGVRFNWQDVDDRDERFGIRVFVGAPFRLLGG